MVTYCELCDCNLPNSPALAQHNIGKRHRRNFAARGSTNPLLGDSSSSPPSDHLYSQPMSPLSVSPPANSGPTAITSDAAARVMVSHESGLDFEVEGTEITGQPPFPSVDLAILIKKTEVVSSLSISAVKLLLSPGTPKSCFSVSVSGAVVQRKKPRRILVSFRAPQAGTFRVSLRIVFSDNTRPSGKEFTVSRELRGRATLPSSHAGRAQPREAFSRSNQVDDHAAPSQEEEDVLLDNQDTGISVSHEDGVDLDPVKRNGLNGPFDTSLSSVTINHANGFPPVTFLQPKIRSWDGSDSR
ncbi:hypothetical protein V8E53_014995 [Lactarius tabidus]